MSTGQTVTRLPRQLKASGPGWSRQADVCVVGSGVAGLRTALHARSYGLSVILVTKVNIDDGSTRVVRYHAGETRHLDFGPGEYLLHELENVGDTQLLFITVEHKLKDDQLRAQQLVGESS